MPHRTRFRTVLLGYDTAEVVDWMRRSSAVTRRWWPGPLRRRAIDALGEPAFHVRARGYARRPVDIVTVGIWQRLRAGQRPD